MVGGTVQRPTLGEKLHIYNVMFGAVPARPTGLAMSVLRRASALSDAGHTVEILVDVFSPEFEDQLRLLDADGRLREGRITLRSMHFDLGGMSVPDVPLAYSSPLGTVSNGWEYSRDAKRADVWRGKQHGHYKHFVWMRGDKVNGIDFLENGKRLHRVWYDFAGRPCKVERMDKDNKPYRIEYVNHQGHIYLQESKSSTGSTTNYALHTKEGILNFKNHSALVHHWLHEIVFKDTVAPLVISEYGFHRASLQDLELRCGARVIYTFHSTHYASPYSTGSPIRAEQRDFFAHINDYKAVVLLTDEQKLDIEKEFGKTGNLYVIPHHMPHVEKLPEDTRVTSSVVMVGRFDAIKGHAQAIEAFSKVVTRHPEATLNLYGRGTEEEHLKELVNDLGLGGSIRFPGFTPNAFSEFSKSSISIVASKYEGFCLSLAESMAAGCVPVTTDFKYGPSDLIDQGKSGIIVEQGNVDEMAEAISGLLSDPERLRTMSDAAREISNRLTEEKLVEDWQQLFAAIGAEENRD